MELTSLKRQLFVAEQTCGLFVVVLVSSSVLPVGPGDAFHSVIVTQPKQKSHRLETNNPSVFIHKRWHHLPFCNGPIVFDNKSGKRHV